MNSMIGDLDGFSKLLLKNSLVYLKLVKQTKGKHISHSHFSLN